MPENERFEKLSRELMHAALELNGSQDGKAGYPQDPVRQARQHTLLVLESVLNALKILFLKRSKAWETLQRLRNTAKMSILTEPLLHLTHNNDRISIALTSLGTILKR